MVDFSPVPEPLSLMPLSMAVRWQLVSVKTVQKYIQRKAKQLMNPRRWMPLLLIFLIISGNKHSAAPVRG